MGIKREINIPGALVPHFYDTYLRTKNPGPLVAIVEHNKQDLLTLGTLVLQTLRGMEPLIDDFIQSIKHMQSYKKQIVHIQEIPSQEACFGELEKPLPENIQNCLLARGIHLYSHQAEAINKARAGKNVVIVTPTASGKTLAFNIPVLEALTNDPKATALYLYPTKALTNDQLKVLRELEKETGVEAYPNVYDGDTPQYQRASIRENSKIILSNPYGLHQYLPWHYKWRRFLANLKFIVIDEAHVYRGVFGSNVAMLLRRLMRICNFYHADPKIILSSATIANPEEHAKKLDGKRLRSHLKRRCTKRKKILRILESPVHRRNKHNSPINPSRNQRPPNT